MADKDIKIKPEIDSSDLDKGTQSIKSFAAQIKDLKKTLQTLPEGSQEYKKVQKQINDLKESQEELNRASKPLAERFKELGGPLGRLGGLIDDVGDKFSVLKGGLNQLGLGFQSFGKALLTTGIGVFVVLLGGLIAAVVKAAKTFEPLQRATEKVGVAFELLLNFIKPVTDFILNVVVGAMEGFATVIAKVTGNLDEFNKKAADAKATAELEKNLKKQEAFFDANGDKYDQYTQRKMKADTDYKKKVVEINKDETLSAKQKEELIVQYRDKRNREINKSDEERRKEEKQKQDEATKKANDDEKAARDKRLQAKKSDLDAQIQLEVNKENTSRAKLKELLDKRYKAELEGQNLSEAQKELLRQEYAKKLEDALNDDAEKRKKKRADELEALIQLEVNKENTSREKLKALLNEKMNQELAVVGLTEEQKEVIRQKYATQLENALKEDLEKRKQNALKQIELAEKTNLKLNDSEVKRLEDISKNEKLGFDIRIDALEKIQQEIIRDKNIQLINLFEKEQALRRAGETEINIAKYVAEQKELIEQGYLDKITPIITETSNLTETANEQQFDSFLKLGSAISSASQLFKEGSAEAKAFAAVQDLVTIAQQANIIATNLQTLGILKKASADGVATTAAMGAAAADGAKQGAKLPFPANLIAIASIVSAVIAIFATIKKTFGVKQNLSTSEPTKTTGSDGGPINVVASRASGGLISGTGTSSSDSNLARVSTGEFVVNARATSAFLPLLSRMNDLGNQPQFAGGTMIMKKQSILSDLQTNSAKSNQNGGFAPIKTYVTATDMSNQQQLERTIKTRSLL